jgi:hypothetical protein
MNGERVLPVTAATPAAAGWPGLDWRAAGWVLAAVSLLAALEAFGLFRRNWILAWPGLLLAAGLAGAALAWRSSRAARGPRWGLAALALAGGLGEVARAAGLVPAVASFVWPAALLALVARCLAPSAGAAGPRWQRLGATLALAGLLRGLEAVFGVQPGAVGTGWFVVLFVAAVQMLRLSR